MAPSRRQIIGRSPLVNQQRQITSFFGKSASTSPSPSPSLSDKKTPKSNPNPNSPAPSPSPPLSNNKIPKSNRRSDPPARSPSPGPTTPSPVQSKFKKPLLVIGQTPSPPKSEENVYGDEVVGKQVRVYWPLDKKWYDGSVILYDKREGKHVVEYEDGEEESLDLGKEKIEWVGAAKSGVRFKRLRSGGSASKKVVMDDDDDDCDVEMANVEEEKENKSDDDDSNDEDWGKNMGKEVCESEEDDVELDDENEIDDEEMVEEKDEETPKGNKGSKTDSRKRKTTEVTKSGGEKKSRTAKDTTLKGFKASVVEPVKNLEEGKNRRVSCCV